MALCRLEGLPREPQPQGEEGLEVQGPAVRGGRPVRARLEDGRVRGEDARVPGGGVLLRRQLGRVDAVQGVVQRDDGRPQEGGGATALGSLASLVEDFLASSRGHGWWWATIFRKTSVNEGKGPECGGWSSFYVDSIVEIAKVSREGIEFNSLQVRTTTSLFQGEAVHQGRRRGGRLHQRRRRQLLQEAAQGGGRVQGGMSSVYVHSHESNVFQCAPRFKRNQSM